MEAPMPLDAPVTMATLPESLWLLVFMMLVVIFLTNAFLEFSLVERRLRSRGSGEGIERVHNFFLARHADSLMAQFAFGEVEQGGNRPESKMAEECGILAPRCREWVSAMILF